MVMLSSISEQHFLTGESTGQVATLQAVPSTEHTVLGQDHKMDHCHLPTAQHTTQSHDPDTLGAGHGPRS